MKKEHVNAYGLRKKNVLLVVYNIHLSQMHNQGVTGLGNFTLLKSGIEFIPDKRYLCMATWMFSGIKFAPRQDKLKGEILWRLIWKMTR